MIECKAEQGRVGQNEGKTEQGRVGQNEGKTEQGRVGQNKKTKSIVVLVDLA